LTAAASPGKVERLIVCGLRVGREDAGVGVQLIFLLAPFEDAGETHWSGWHLEQIAADGEVRRRGLGITLVDDARGDRLVLVGRQGRMPILEIEIEAWIDAK